MTPKEKAVELVQRFIKIESFHIHERVVFMPLPEAKQCALIAVEEILSDYKNYLMHENTEYKGLMYWQEVKKEIELL
jgi:hypothetical protein